jgi:Stage II sporulation protein E (SpoIIE)
MSLAVGVGIGLLMAISNGGHHFATYMILCGTGGLAIFATARLLSWPFDRLVRRLSRPAILVARGAQFAVSGVVAWFLVMAVGERWLDVRYGSDWPLYLAFTGGLAVTVGFTFYGFGVIRDRLEASVARLKEVEFAEKELQLARELQSRLLPPPEIVCAGYHIAARNLAARLVAGDFYDCFLLPDGALGVAVGDVAGKGMTAALIMASVKAMLPLVAAGRSAAETLREVNRRLAAELAGREFVALAFVRLEPAGGTLELANAGLPDPYLLVPGQPPAPLVVAGPRLPLGVRREVEYRSLRLRLGARDRLLLLSDGLPEAPAAGGEPLGYAALAELVAAIGDTGGTGGDGGGGEARSGDLLQWIDALIERVRAATQPTLEDDWTALLLESGAPATEAAPAAEPMAAAAR